MSQFDLVCQMKNPKIDVPVGERHLKVSLFMNELAGTN